MMTGTLKHQKLTVFQKEEAELIMKTSCYIINEIPYAAEFHHLLVWELGLIYQVLLFGSILMDIN